MYPVLNLICKSWSNQIQQMQRTGTSLKHLFKSESKGCNFNINHSNVRIYMYTKKNKLIW